MQAQTDFRVFWTRIYLHFLNFLAQSDVAKSRKYKNRECKWVRCSSRVIQINFYILSKTAAPSSHITWAWAPYSSVILATTVSYRWNKCKVTLKHQTQSLNTVLSTTEEVVILHILHLVTKLAPVLYWGYVYRHQTRNWFVYEKAVIQEKVKMFQSDEITLCNNFCSANWYISVLKNRAIRASSIFWPDPTYRPSYIIFHYFKCTGHITRRQQDWVEIWPLAVSIKSSVCSNFYQVLRKT